MTTVIFVHTNSDVNFALDYLSTSKSERVVIFPTDVAALTQLHNINPSLINHLDQYVTRNKSIDNQIFIPYQIAKKAPLLLREVFRAQLVKVLSHTYILQQIYRHHRPQKIISSQNSFSPLALKHFSTKHQLILDFFPQQIPSAGEWITLKLTQIHQQLNFLLNHFQILTNMLFATTPPQKKSTRIRILVFSNGLNLVSYHSTLKALRKTPHVDCKIITNKQRLLDRFYLAKYNISAQEISQIHRPASHLPKLFHHPKLLIQATFNAAYSHQASIIDKYVNAQKIVAAYKPHLVITTHDPGPSGLSFVLAAKEKKIPTLVLLHGSPSHIHFFHSDKQLIWGSLMKKQLHTKAHMPIAKLIIGGHPIYHDYRQFFKHHLPITNPSPKIGILTTGDGQYEWHQAEYFYTLFGQLQHLKKPFTVSIRTHGMQSLPALKKLGQQFGLQLTVNPPQTLEEFIADCKVIISQNSTAALVGLIAHKPVILYDPWFPFLDEGLLKYSSAFIKPKSVGEISKLVNAALGYKQLPSQLYKKQTQFLRAYCGKLDAKAGERLAKRIIEICL